MHKIIYLLPFLLLSLNLIGQSDQHVVHLTAPKQLNNLGFEIAEVLDRRIDKSNIGFAQIEQSSKRVPAIFPEKFEPYIDRTLKELSNSTGEKITIIIHEFFVAEYTKAASTQAKFRIQMEFAKLVDGQLYSVGFSEQEIEGAGEYVEIRYGKMIMTGLKRCLKNFARTDWKTIEGERIDSNLEFNFDYTKTPKRGLYSSFAKMARNEPFMETGFVVRGTSSNLELKYHKFMLEDERRRTLKKRIMGFSYSNNIYIQASTYYHGSYFVRALLVGKYLYFEDRFSSDEVAGMMFGLVGRMATNSAKGIILDTENGFVVILSDHEMNELLKKYPSIKESYLQSKQKLADKKAAIEAINALY